MIDAQVRAVALGWLGVPFRHQGRSREHGVDCAGLAICVARELGLVEPDWDVTGYRRMPDGTMRAHCDARLDTTESLAAAHLALIRFAIEPQHLAVIVPRSPDGWSLVHALERSGRVVQHRLDALWRSRIVRLYRYRETAWRS